MIQHADVVDLFLDRLVEQVEVSLKLTSLTSTSRFVAVARGKQRRQQQQRHHAVGRDPLAAARAPAPADGERGHDAQPRQQSGMQVEVPDQGHQEDRTSSD